MNSQRYILTPISGVITDVIQESRDVKTFIIEPVNRPMFAVKPGQFILITYWGYGEAPFAISRVFKKGFAVSIKRVGHLTRVLHRAVIGEEVGLRGPYGNPFPLEKWFGKKILIIGGGIGLAPLRSVIDHIIKDFDRFKGLEIVFGVRTPDDIIYKDDLQQWAGDKRLRLYTTIDKPHPGWSGRVGLIPEVIKEIGFKPDDRYGVLCGPEIMIKFTAVALRSLGWSDHQLYTTLERKMQCGIGLCGRCNLDEKLICKDGPVFSLDQLQGVEL